MTPDDAAREVRVRYHELFEFAAEAQVVTDADGVIAEANIAACDLFAIPKQYLVGRPLGLLCVRASMTPFYDLLRRLTAGNRTGAMNARMNRRGGTPREVEVTAQSHRPDAGGPAAIRWGLHDLTEWNRTVAERDRLALKLGSAQEDERKRISRDLHDTVGQLLTGLLLAARAARLEVPPGGGAAARLDAVETLAGQLGREVHGLAVRLRPTSLDDLGLDAALRQQVAEFSARSNIPADYFAVGPEGTRLAPEVETALYRIAQEALTNVSRHAKASRVGVTLELGKGRGVLTVEDDGVGFDPDSSTARLGVIGMQERATLAGGELAIEAQPGQGTSVMARFPASQDIRLP